MGPYQSLVGFASKEDMELARNEHGDFLKSWFSEVREWRKEDTQTIRRVWVEIRGVPPNAWSRTNAELFVGAWEGNIVDLSYEFFTGHSFTSIKALIDTTYFDRIEGRVILQLEDGGYQVRVTEISPSARV